MNIWLDFISDALLGRDCRSNTTLHNSRRRWPKWIWSKVDACVRFKARLDQHKELLWPTIIKCFCGHEGEGYSHATLKFPCMWLMERWLGSWEVSYGDSEVGLITGRPSIRWKKACEIFIAFYYSAGTMWGYPGPILVLYQRDCTAKDDLIWDSIDPST